MLVHSDSGQRCCLWSTVLPLALGGRRVLNRMRGTEGGAGCWESLASLAREALSALTSSFLLLDSISPAITTVLLGL